MNRIRPWIHIYWFWLFGWRWLCMPHMGSYWLGIKLMIAHWKYCPDTYCLEVLYSLNQTMLTWGRNVMGRTTNPWKQPTDTLSRGEAIVTMNLSIVFDWNHSIKGCLWRSKCVKHHVDTGAEFWVNSCGAWLSYLFKGIVFSCVWTPFSNGGLWGDSPPQHFSSKGSRGGKRQSLEPPSPGGVFGGNAPKVKFWENFPCKIL